MSGASACHWSVYSGAKPKRMMDRESAMPGAWPYSGNGCMTNRTIQLAVRTQPAAIAVACVSHATSRLCDLSCTRGNPSTLIVPCFPHVWDSIVFFRSPVLWFLSGHATPCPYKCNAVLPYTKSRSCEAAVNHSTHLLLILPIQAQTLFSLPPLIFFASGCTT